MKELFSSRRSLFTLVLIAIVLVGGVIATREVVKRIPSPELIEAQEKWRPQNIRDYRLEVKITYPAEPSLGGNLLVVMRNGELFSKECTSKNARCALFWAPDNKQGVDVLFDMSHYNRMFQDYEEAYVAEGCSEVTFNDEYGFPQLIDNWNCVDPEHGINHGVTEVVSFEIIDPQTAPAPTKGPLPTDWNTRWLKNQPCKLPCWEGVTPGVTTSREAFELLKQSPQFTQVSLRRLGQEYEKEGIISWEWFGQQGRGEIEFRLGNEETVYDIEPFASWPDLPFTLGQIVEALGEPDDVITTDFCPTWQGGRRLYHVEFRYRTLGLYLDGPYVYLQSIDIQPDIGIEKLHIFDPKEGWDDFVYTNTDYHRQFIKVSPWQGYQDYYFYSGTDPNLVCT